MKKHIMGYDSKGQVLKYTIQEIKEAKERIILKRSIRRKTRNLIPINLLTTNQLISINELL